MSQILQLLVQKYSADGEKANEALALSKKKRISLIGACEQLKVLPIDKLLEVFAEFYQVESVVISELKIAQSMLALVPIDFAKKFRVIPIDKVGNNLVVAISDPRNRRVIDALRFKTRFNIQPMIAAEIDITKAVERYYNNKVDLSKVTGKQALQASETKEKKSDRIIIGDKAAENDGPIIKLVNFILKTCLHKGASDIHIEPYETTFRIRMRIDGSLIEIVRPPLEMKDALTSRIKIMSDMDIAEKRQPQDGAINVEIEGKPIDFRVNAVPTNYGEKIVLRILDKSALNVDMTVLGFETDDLERFINSVHNPHGMVLVTGPTGSGKTTTLYSAMAELNKETENIMTGEDPVEFQLEGINQVQMRPDVGLNFAAALRAFLRQDPDIIMVGEIRDLETANISIKAALTGHMVLSTLHTNSAADTIVRLINMGVEPFNLVAALNCIVAQRLTKKICPKCKTEDTEVTDQVLIDLGIHPSFVSKIKPLKGVGCDYCSYLGTKGRQGLQEVLVMNSEIKSGVLRNASAMELKKLAMQSGMRTLRQNALNKMARGEISAAEVVRVSGSDKDKKKKAPEKAKPKKKPAA